MRDPTTGVCGECDSPPEAYHLRDCSQFRGYRCFVHAETYFGDRCPHCRSLDSVTGEEETNP